MCILAVIDSFIFIWVASTLRCLKRNVSFEWLISRKQVLYQPFLSEENVKHTNNWHSNLEMNLIEEKYTSLNVRVSKNGVCNLAFCFTNQKIYETWNRIHRTRKSPYYSFYMTITTPFRFLLGWIIFMSWKGVVFMLFGHNKLCMTMSLYPFG